MSNVRAIVMANLLLLLCGLSVLPAMGQQVEPARQTPAVIQYNGDMSNMLAHLPSVYGRTIGLEVDPQQRRSVVQFYLKEPTLADVLNEITRCAPVYRWSEKDDTVEIGPLAGGSPFLDTPIESFRVDYADAAEAINQLINLPEVQTSMTALKLRYREPQTSSAVDVGKKMTFAVHGVTLRQVLNRIAIENGSRFWVLQRDTRGSFAISTTPVRN